MSWRTTPYAVPVIDENGRYAGAVSRSALLQALDNMIGEDKPAMAAAARYGHATNRSPGGRVT